MVSGSIENIVYSAFCIEDLPDVVAVEVLSTSMPWTERLFLNELNSPRSVSLIARADGDIAGYIFADHLLDEGNILNVAVHPGFRRRGIAAELVRRMVNILKGCGCRSLYLEVRVSNIAAIGLYERAGFRNIGTRKNYYVTPQEDAAIMSLGISE